MRVLYGIIAVIFCSMLIYGQNKKAAHPNLQGVTCKTCHSCDVPTKQNPCLIPCPRDEMITVDESAEKGPNIVKLNKLEKKYMPVMFSHKAHAQMSQMYGGCSNCHHHNAIGPIQSCSNCHSKERKRVDLSKPDLEAAYHRQCINCHRNWSHSNDCTSCHALRTNSKVKITGTTQVKVHPKVEEPNRIIFETNYDDGKVVTFYHEEHINKFNITCSSCHENDNCTSCHDKLKYNKAVFLQFDKPVKISKTDSDHHKPCFSCHENDDCTVCHKDKISGPFNHAKAAGWALNKFHGKLSCQKCHGSSNKFVKLNNSCISCHKNFKQGSFNHKVTGLQLNETHSSLDCSDCHEENNFSKKPACTNCHDDKSFPKDKPGTLVKTSLK